MEESSEVRNKSKGLKLALEDDYGDDHIFFTKHYYGYVFCCILLWSDPNWSMLLLLGILLQLLTPINSGEYKQFAALSQITFFQDVEYHYDNILEKLHLQTLHIRRRHFDALSLINAFSGTKYCPSLLETVGIRVTTRNIRNFTMFSCSFSHCRSARCVSTSNAVCKSTDSFTKSYYS
jgi:hypothetical protein